MNKSSYIQITGTIFAVLAIAHVLRLLYGWEAVIAGFAVPMWLSIIAILVAGYLAYTAWSMKK